MIEKGELVRRIVTTGRSDERGGRIEILKGLAPGAQVLAARFDNLREGDSVEFEVGQGPKGPRAENVRRTST